jgi:very-short-patch-repair endonuclease
VTTRLIIEADGAPHFPTRPRDFARDRWLMSVGFMILPFENRKILDEPDGVLQRIVERLTRPPQDC